MGLSYNNDKSFFVTQIKTKKYIKIVYNQIICGYNIVKNK